MRAPSESPFREIAIHAKNLKALWIPRVDYPPIHVHGTMEAPPLPCTPTPDVVDAEELQMTLAATRTSRRGTRVVLEDLQFHLFIVSMVVLLYPWA
jgi:hypothetical protein